MFSFCPLLFVPLSIAIVEFHYGTVDVTTVQIVAGPDFGTATVDPVSGDITYTSNPGAAFDRISYRVKDNDGDLSTFGTIFISISP